VDLVHRLWHEGSIKIEDLKNVLEKERKWNIPSRKIVRHLTPIGKDQYLSGYSATYGFPKADAGELEVLQSLPEGTTWDLWKNSQAFPALTKSGRNVVAAVDPVGLPSEIRSLNLPVLLVAEEDLILLAGRIRGREILSEAVTGLFRKDPDASARKTFTRGQLVSLWLLSTGSLAAFVLHPVFTLIAASILINGFYFAAMVFKAILAFAGFTNSSLVNSLNSFGTFRLAE